MTEEDRLFSIASLIYTDRHKDGGIPSPETSYVGNARVSLRSAEGALLAHIPIRQVNDALASGRFGDVDDELSSLIKRRADAKAKDRERREKYLSKLIAIALTWLPRAKVEQRTTEPTERTSQSTLIRYGALMLGGLATVWAVNFISLQLPLNTIISSDPRNSSVSASASYQWMINPGVIVFSVNDTSSATPADITRILLQYAERLESRAFNSVLLARNGKPVFVLKGEYFKQLGEEYGSQNVIYTLRTLPENVYELDGSPAFSSWSGGWLGVMSKQLEDLNIFYSRWLADET